MFKNFGKNIFLKVKKYDKKATNPFLKNDLKYDFNKSLHEQTYIWVEKNTDSS